MTPNPYPSDTLKCMRGSNKVYLRNTISTLIALITPPTAIQEDETHKIQQATNLLEEVLADWNRHKEQ